MAFGLREAIISYLGTAAQKPTSFGVAAGGSFFVAARSYTTIPVSTVIYYGDADIKATLILPPRLALSINIPSCDIHRNNTS